MWWNTDKDAVAKGAQELDAELKKEAGDILWQLSGLCQVMGWELEDVATGNLDKLASRQRRGVIDGNGDNR
jgi:NTP pyrophosphatase (non-canonical NTP hydrolase)